MNQIEFDFLKGMTSLLNEVDEVYRSTGNRLITKEQYDVRLEDLRLLEKETGIAFANSPTIKTIDDIANVNYLLCNQEFDLPDFIKESETSVPIINEEELIRMLNS